MMGGMADTTIRASEETAQALRELSFAMSAEQGRNVTMDGALSWAVEVAKRELVNRRGRSSPP